MKVQAKIVILVCLSLLITGLPSATGILLYERQHTLVHYEDHARALAETALVLLEHSMVEAGVHDVGEIVKRVTVVPEITEVVFFDAGGRVVASWRAEDILGAGEEDVGKDEVARALAEGEPGLAWETHGGAQHIGVFLPIENKLVCRECHTSDQPYIGVLELGLDTTHLAADLRKDLLFMGGAILAVTAVTAVLLSLSFAMLVSRRIVRLRELAARIGAGDYLARSSESGGDEIAALAGSMEGMAARLGELERRRDEIISIAAHELRTPMTGVMGLSELLLVRDVDEETRRKWLRRIYEESQRLTSIMDEFLSVTRIQSGRMTIELGPVGLSGLVEEVLSLYSSTEGKFQFSSDVPSGLPQAWADRDKLKQVLVNLVDNAVKYSPRGGPVSVSARHDLGQQRLVVSVADRGIGIAPADRERLFKTFGRIQRPETMGVRGSGLGLYVVTNLLDMMHGEIWLESELDRGSTFHFSLPVCAPTPPLEPGQV